MIFVITLPQAGQASNSEIIRQLRTLEVLFNDASTGFVTLDGVQTITGAKTFDSSALKLEEAGGTQVATIAVASLAADRTYTVPDAGAAASFVMTEGTQAIGGVKTVNGKTVIGSSVVVGTATAATTTTSATYVDTSLTASITPTTNTRRIKITVSSVAGIGADGERAIYGLERGTTDLQAAGMSQLQSPTQPVYVPLSFTYIDSPATTSATTYTLRIKSAGGGTVYDNPNGTLCSIVLEEII